MQHGGLLKSPPPHNSFLESREGAWIDCGLLHDTYCDSCHSCPVNEPFPQELEPNQEAGKALQRLHSCVADSKYLRLGVEQMPCSLGSPAHACDRGAHLILNDLTTAISHT